MSARDGKPCRKCGANEWYANGKCAPCTRERNLQWQRANPDKVSKSTRRWQNANAERVAEVKRQWQKDNPEKVNESSRRYAKAHPEKVAGYNRQWRRNNPEKVAEQNRRWNGKNTEKRAELGHEWYEANSEKVSQNTRRWRRDNHERSKELARRWRKDHPENNVACVARYRTAQTNAGGSYTAAEWKDLCNHYGNRCLCCGRDDVKLEVDHVIPVTKGGTSNIDNIQPLCRSCNASKSNKEIDYRPGTGLGRWIQKKLFG